jgi:hypothetical protein
MAEVIGALNIAFKWMLPSPRPNLREGVDNVSAAKLKIALSVAFPILSRYHKIADEFPAFFIYNSWRHICRILREYELSMGDQLHRACVSGWINGCCNLQNPMSIHRGRTFRLTEKPIENMVREEGCYSGFIGDIEIKMLFSKKRDCFWVLMYYRGWLSGSYRYNDILKTKHISDNLRKLMEAGGLFCLGGYGHFLPISQILDSLYSGRCVYEVNMPPELYLMNLSSTDLIEAWSKGELSVRYSAGGMTVHDDSSELDEDLYQFLGPMGHIGLTHLLSKKYDEKTANILSSYSKDFWGDGKCYLRSLKFLIEKNCSKTFRNYVSRNWQGKRYCNDICHLLYLSGYPRLWYYEKEMKVTKCCLPYMPLCEYKERSHTVLIKGARKGFNYLKEKKKLTKNILDRYQDILGDWYTKNKDFQKCHLINYDLEVKNQNAFISSNKLFNKLNNVKSQSLEKKLEVASSIDMSLPESSLQKHKVMKEKMSYAMSLTKDLETVAEEIVKIDRCRALSPIIKLSLENCQKAKSDLNEAIKPKVKMDSNGEWEIPKKTTKKWVKFNLGRDKFEVSTDNVFEILDGYEKDCKEKLKGISSVDRTDDRDHFHDVVDMLKAEANYSRNRLHKKLRKEREWGNAEPEIIMSRIHKRNVGKGRCRHREKRRPMWIKNNNKRAADIQSCKKKGVISKYIKIKEHYQQYRCIRVVNLRKSKIISEARRRVKIEPMYFFPFPKVEFKNQKYDERGIFNYTTPTFLKRIKNCWWERPAEEEVVYHDRFGKIVLDKKCAHYTKEGVELYLDRDRTIRYAIYPNGEIIRFGKRGNRSKKVGPKQPVIKIVKFDEFSPEFLSTYLRDLLDYYS